MRLPAPTAELPPFSPRLLAWFGRYLEHYFRRSFDGVRLSRHGAPPADPGRAMVVYSNHPSWWDPILYMLVARRCYPDREGYGPMDAQALARYGFFRRLGIFGVERDSRRGAATFLRVGRAVLARPTATLWLTAEGAFTDPRTRPVSLAPGLAHLVSRSRDLLVVPLALEYPFWNERLPEALLRFGAPITVEDGGERTAGEWQELLTARLEATLDALAEEARSRDPERFVTLLAGRAGVGGVYDRWRRLRAALRGERFVAAHEERPR